MAFFTSAINILQTLVVAIGAGLAVWGVINLLEGYGNDNHAAAPKTWCPSSLSLFRRSPVLKWLRWHIAGSPSRSRILIHLSLFI